MQLYTLGMGVFFSSKHLLTDKFSVRVKQIVSYAAEPKKDTCTYSYRSSRLSLLSIMLLGAVNNNNNNKIILKGSCTRNNNHQTCFG